MKAIADGDEVLQSDGGRDVQEQRLLANEIACELVAINETDGDFGLTMRIDSRIGPFKEITSHQ